MSTTLQKKPRTKRVSTTLRMDSALREEIYKFTEERHIDFSTFVDYSLRETLVRGIRIEPRMSDERYAYYTQLADDVDSGKEPSYGPFHGKEAIEFLKKQI